MPDDSEDYRVSRPRLKELPEKVQQEQMTTALERLVHLQTAGPVIADSKPA
ncbi:MAG TPA: hypothetical protein VIX14_01950 [Terriglobales bacterium]